MGMTTPLQNALLDEYFAVERFMSLHLASPGASGNLATEVPTIGTGYARQSLFGKVGQASGGLVINTQTITFPPIALEYGGPVSDFATSRTLAGALDLFGAFNESLLKGVGSAYQYPPGTLRFQFR